MRSIDVTLLRSKRMELKHRNDLKSGNTQPRFKGNQQRKSVNRSDYCLRRLGMPVCSRWKSVTLRAIMSLMVYLRHWLGIRADRIIGCRAQFTYAIPHIATSTYRHSFFLPSMHAFYFSQRSHHCYLPFQRRTSVCVFEELPDNRIYGMIVAENFCSKHRFVRWAERLEESWRSFWSTSLYNTEDR